MRHKLSGRFVLRLPQSLHGGLVKAAEKEGVSLNQYCVYLLSKYVSSAALLSTFEKIDNNLAKTSPAKVQKIIKEAIQEAKLK